MTRAITSSSEEWPALLREADPVGPPNELFVEGSPIESNERVIAVVGTRRPTLTGIETTRRLCEGFAQAGFTVVSGLAVGVDAIAHRATLDAGGNTIAVLGCGLDVVYPKSNAALRQRIQNGGTIVSEYALGTAPVRANFPRRNRIIAALSKGVVVVEGTIRSGALITARFALDLNRNVYAVPGSVRNPMAEGPNELIRTDQASLITEPQHVFDDVAPEFVWRADEGFGGAAEAVKLDEGERQVVQVLDDVGISVDRLCREVELTPGAVGLALARLQVRGLVVQRRGAYELTIAGSRVRGALARTPAGAGSLF